MDTLSFTQRLLASGVVLVAAGAFVAFAFSQPLSSAHFVTGTLSLETAQRLKLVSPVPGGVSSGTMAITDTGTLGGQLYLSAVARGTARRLQLQVWRGQQLVYAGPLTVDSHPTGRIAPHETVRFRFVIARPPGVPGGAAFFSPRFVATS
jgi:hypothetical protein